MKSGEGTAFPSLVENGHLFLFSAALFPFKNVFSIVICITS